jgi:hypothetical protein
MAVRLAEAQQLYDALQDPLIRPALQEFFQEQRTENIDALLHAVQQHLRDTMKEARLAGKVEAYETAMSELQRFAEKQLRESSQ